MKISNNTILITGGGTGIGQALAHRFYELGNTVIVAGRRSEALEQTIAGHAGMFACTVDIESAADIARFAAEMISNYPKLNVLINNAGIMRIEDVTATRDLADAEATISTNLLGPIRVTNALMSHLAGQSASAIVNVSSGLAFVPLAITPTYNATKAALHSYTIAMREQLKGRVEVIEVVPPAVQTDLTPGQSTREGYMPLTTFIDEVMTLFEAQPTPTELLVERVKFLRDAEAEQRFDQAFAALNTL